MSSEGDLAGVSVKDVKAESGGRFSCLTRLGTFDSTSFCKQSNGAWAQIIAYPAETSKLF